MFREILFTQWKWTRAVLLPLVIVISFFIGAVSVIQAQYQFRGFVPANYLGTAVCKLVIIESGPVLTALVLAGRVVRPSPPRSAP